jgi:HEAT repeat protein
LSGGKSVDDWVQALAGPDARLRKTAVLKLGNVGPADPAVLPAVLGALEDRDAGVRREAILALMKYGDGARQAAPILAAMRQRDADARVRSDAAKALQRLKKGAESS